MNISPSVLLMVCVLGLPALIHAAPGKKCLTPHGTPGVCLSLPHCPALWDQLEHGDSSSSSSSEQQRLRSSVEFIMSSKCKYKSSREQTFCCPMYLQATTTTKPPTSDGLVFRVDEAESENSVLPDECGDMGAMDMIAGGSTAVMGHYPWLARLEFSTARGAAVLCGGVLISRRYVLTSAQCLQKHAHVKLSHVVLGEHDTRTNPDCVRSATGGHCADPVIRVAIESTLQHPKFRASKHRHNDIGLVRLSRDVHDTEFVRPICLPRRNQPSSLLESTAQILAGWGRTENGSQSAVKLQVTLPVVNNEECRRLYSTVRLDLADTQMCAGGQQGMDSCSGDSGGPLMYLQGGKCTVSGVASLGPVRCGEAGQPGVYTRVTSFVPWILSNMKP